MQPTTLDLHQLVATAGDGMIVAGTDGRIQLWNEAATRIFGFSEEEALAATLDLIIPERLRPRHWAGYDKTMETAYSARAIVVISLPRANGGLRYVASSTAASGKKIATTPEYVLNWSLARGEKETSSAKTTNMPMTAKTSSTALTPSSTSAASSR